MILTIQHTLTTVSFQCRKVLFTAAPPGFLQSALFWNTDSIFFPLYGNSAANGRTCSRHTVWKVRLASGWVFAHQGLCRRWERSPLSFLVFDVKPLCGTFMPVLPLHCFILLEPIPVQYTRHPPVEYIPCNAKKGLSPFLPSKNH